MTPVDDEGGRYMNDIDEVDEGVEGGLLGRQPLPEGLKGDTGRRMNKKKVGGWTFWDLMGWKPMRVMCMTMFLNSYVFPLGFCLRTAC